ncbi:MAG: rhodanese-like domain-containing protein, partial [Bacteroidia bacterium]|nr:rhodanese-like domain-containing protein [Bacteroidia bacterium]
AIGYEANLRGVFVGLAYSEEVGPELFSQVESLRNDGQSYTIIDVRGQDEAASRPSIRGALNIPLDELRERLAEVPRTRPIIVHCAGGYRSAIGSSLLLGAGFSPVYDAGEAIQRLLG